MATDLHVPLNGDGPGGWSPSIATVEEGQAALARLMQVASVVWQERQQLQTALDSRVVIEQAKGILAERHGITVEEAFQRLRRVARSNRTKIHTLARTVVESAGRTRQAG